MDIDLSKLNGYGISLANLIDAVRSHNEDEVIVHAKSIINIAKSHKYENKEAKNDKRRYNQVGRCFSAKEV
jgi:hypothetical protein